MKRRLILLSACCASLLAQAIDNDSIGGAALDVFAREPLPGDSPLLRTRHPEKLRFTPHTAWASVEARTRLINCIADNIRTEMGL